MGDAYPELARERDTIVRWARAEEESFGRTLEQGERLLAELIAGARRTQAPRGSPPRTRSGCTTPTASPTS